jgi:sugar lactone lactonase YvrE
MTWTFQPLLAAPLPGELDGPTWDGRGLLFANVTKNEILRYDPLQMTIATIRKNAVRTRGLAFAPDGRLYAAQTRSRRIVWYKDDGTAYYVESTIEGQRRNDPQHLAIDRAGRIWSTDLWTDESTPGPVGYPPLGHCSVLRATRTAADGDRVGRWTLERMTHDTVAPRGIALAPDEQRLYVADTGDASTPATLRAYDVAASGTLGEARVLRRYPDGESAPAGLAVTAGGLILVAIGGARPRIEVVEADGPLVSEHALSAEPTACAFGGAALDVLFVTTTRGDLLSAAGTGYKGCVAARGEERGTP